MAEGPRSFAPVDSGPYEPLQEEEQPTPQPSSQQGGMPTPQLPASFFDLNPLQRPFGIDPFAARSRETDLVGQVVQGAGFEGGFTEQAARELVYQERNAGIEYGISQQETFEALQQSGLMDLDAMTPEQVEDLVSIVDLDMGPAETFAAASEFYMRADDLSWVERYNAGGALIGPEATSGSFGNFVREGWTELANSHSRADRRREMWNELTPFKRRQLMDDYGIKPPTPFGIGGDTVRTFDSTGDWVVEQGNAVMNTLWAPVKSLIGVVDWAWRSGMRLYRGQVIADEMESGEQAGPDNTGWSLPMATIPFTGRSLDLAPGITEAVRWLEANNPLRLLNPGGVQDWSRRWDLGGGDPALGGEDVLSPVVREETADMTGLDEMGMDLATALAGRMDSSLFGSPLQRLEAGENTADRFLNQIIAYGTETQNVPEEEAEAAEAAAIAADYDQAMDALLLERIPGTSPEAAQARAGLRLRLKAEPALMAGAINLAMKGKISYGRQTAARLGHEPGTVEFNRAAGRADVVGNIFLDPTVLGAKARAASRVMRAIPRSDTLAAAVKMQDVFDGVIRTPRTGTTVPVPMLGNGFRRSLDEVTQGLTESINAKLNAEVFTQPNIADNIEAAGGVVEESTGVNRGFDRIMRNEPRFADYFDDIEAEVLNRLRSSGDDWKVVDEATGQTRLADDAVQPQMIVDWMKSEEGINAIVNGRLGGVMSKTPTLPSTSVLGQYTRAVPRNAKRALEFIDGATGRVAQRYAAKGYFDEFGRETVNELLDTIRADDVGKVADDAEAAARVRTIDELKTQLNEVEDLADLDEGLRRDLAKILDDKSRANWEKLDNGEDISMPVWNLEVVAAKLDQPEAIRKIGLNATMLRGQSTLPQMIRAIRKAKVGEYGAAKKAIAGVRALSWAPVQFVNGVARSFTIIAPSSVLKFGTGGANATIRNYASLLDSNTRARLTNAFASGATDVDQISLARNIMLEVADTLGLPYTEYGRRFMDEHMRMFDAAGTHRYSMRSGNNFVGVGNGMSTAVLDNQVSNAMALPNFTKLQNVATRTAAKIEYINPAVLSNMRAVDVFIGTIWTPSVLFRLGFGVRTSADEMMAAIARDGLVGALQGRIAYSAASDTNVVPSLMRPDRSLARSALRLMTFRRKAAVGDLNFETRAARALGLPEEVVDVLRKTQVRGKKIEGVPGVSMGTEGARVLLQRAITQANPYELVSLKVADRMSEFVEYLDQFDFLKSDTFKGAMDRLAEVQKMRLADKKQMLQGWGPNQVHEAWKVMQSKLVPERIYLNARRMIALQHDVSRHLQNPHELSAAMNPGVFQTQQADVLAEARRTGPNGRMVHPNDRKKQLVADGYEVRNRGDSLEPEFLNALLGNMEEFMASKAGRHVLDVFLDDARGLGQRLETGAISYGQWRHEMHGALMEALESDPDLLAQFRTSMGRSRTLRDGRSVLNNYDEVKDLAGTTAADLAWREKAARAMVEGRVLDPSEATEHLGDLTRESLDEWLEEDGWTVIVEEGRAPDTPALGRTNHEGKTITLYEEELNDQWARLESRAADRQALIDSEGQLPEGWDQQWGTEYMKEMGVDWHDFYLWARENGGVDALREKTRWHEIGHAYLQNTIEEGRLTRLEREVEAESFAYAAMGAPFGDRDFVLDLIQQRRQAAKPPPPPTRTLDEALGGMMTDMGAEYLDEATDGLDSLATSIRRALAADFEDVGEAGKANFRLLVLDDLLDGTGLTSRNMFALANEMLEDGLYVATRMVDDVDTYANQTIDRLAELVNRNGMDAFTGEFPVDDELLEAVADYAEYLSAGIGRFRGQGDVLDAIADEGTARLMDQLAADGLEGIDSDVLERLDKYADVEVPEFQRRGGPSAPLRTPAEGDEVARVGDDATRTINRPRTERDMLRLAREFTSNQYASPQEALEEWADVLLDELEARWFSSPESVANDITSGTYQPAPGARIWLPVRDADGRIIDLTEAGPEAMKSSTVRTEMIETVEDHDEALRLVREGKATPFLRPLNEVEMKTARRSIEDTLAKMEDEALAAIDRDPELREWAIEGVHTYEDFLRYVAVTTRRNGGELDEFVVKVLDTIRQHPSSEGVNIGPVLDRLVMGMGRDTYQRMRPMTSIEHFKEIVRRYDEGLEPLTTEELRRIGPRLPDRSYAPRLREQGRFRTREFVNNAYGVMMPVVDYLTRHPLMTFFYDQGIESMRPVILTNRPRERAVIEAIEQSDRVMADLGGARSRMSRNGYVSMREIKDEIRDLAPRVVDKDAPTLSVSHPGVQRLLDEARIDPKVLDTASGRWFWGELMPELVEQFPPRARGEETVMLFRGMDREMDPSLIGEEGTRFTDQLDYALNNTNADTNTVIYAIEVPKSRMTVGVSELGELSGGPKGALFTADELAGARRVDLDEARRLEGTSSPATEAESFDEYWERVSDFVLDTEIDLNDAAMTNAMTKLLSYTDNEATATLFSSKYRNLFPFFWAQERFLKRVFQSFAYNPQGFARGNAVFRGLGHSTIPMEDQDGNPIFVAPMSGFTEAAARRWVEIFAEDTDYVIPDGMGRWAYRWDRIIPGGTESPPFPEAPNILFGMAGKAIASRFPETEVIIRSLVGDMALNEERTILESGLPANVLRVFAAMDPEKVRETFADAAITTFQDMIDSGDVPGPEASDEEWDDFYLALDNWTQVNAVLAVVHGFAGVASPQFEAVPGSEQHEWRDIMSNYGWEGGRSVFRERYPDATLYTIFRTETTGGAPIPASRAVNEWMISHEDTIKTYPEGSQFLVPTAEYTDEFVSSAWARMQRLGLRGPRWEGEGKEYWENVHDDLEFQRWAPEYYQTRDVYEREIDFYRRIGNGPLRDAKEQEWKAWERGFFSTRKRFKRVKESQGESMAKRVQVLDNLRELDRRYDQGDEAVVRLIEGNERAEMTLEMIRDYDKYIENPSGFSEYDGKEYDLMRMANRRAFIEYWESRVRQNPNELMHIWERVILPNFPEFNRDDAEAMLLGTEMP